MSSDRTASVAAVNDKTREDDDIVFHYVMSLEAHRIHAGRCRSIDQQPPRSHTGSNAIALGRRNSLDREFDRRNTGRHLSHISCQQPNVLTRTCILIIAIICRAMGHWTHTVIPAMMIDPVISTKYLQVDQKSPPVSYYWS